MTTHHRLTASALRLTAVLLLFLLFLPLTGHAQDGVREVDVNDEQTIAAGDTLLLNVYFTLRDQTGRADPGAGVESAAILLEDGSLTDAQVSRPPFYIAILLDASGSMAGSEEAVQAAAAQLVEQAPPETHFAVIRFEESIQLLQTFTNNHTDVLDAVNRYEVSDSGTCLYDVAVTAVQSLNQLAEDAPRRAIVLLSDGRDEIQQGGGDTCSQFTFDQLVDFATNRDVPVPVYTLGISDNPNRINSEELTALAQATGGAYADNEPESLDAAVETAVNRIRSQWVAGARLYPDQGFQQGALLVILSDGSRPQPGGVAFTAGRSYREPLPPLTLDIDNFTYDPINNRYQFTTPTNRFQEIRSLRLQVIDNESNIQVTQTTFNDPWSQTRFEFSGDPLRPDRAYILNVYPLDLNNQIITDDGDPVIAQYTFQHEPPRPLIFTIDAVDIEDEPPSFNLSSFRYEDDPATLTADLHVENDETVTGYTAYFVDANGNAVGDPFSLDVTAGPQGSLTTDPIPFPFESGDYALLVSPIAGDETRLATERYDFTYTLPLTPWARSWLSVQENPLLATILLLLFLLIGFLAWRVGHWTGDRTAKREPARGLDLSTLPTPEPEPTLPAVQLQVAETPDPTMRHTVHRVTAVPFTIGREKSDLNIPGDRHVSRRHARLIYENGLFHLEDAGSANGTFVNEAPIAAGDAVPISAAIGAKIRLGKTTTLTFQEAPSPNGNGRHADDEPAPAAEDA